jgi:hypothetical protein
MSESMRELVRPVAIVLNVLLLGMMALNIADRGLPASGDQEAFLVLLAILAPVSSLAAVLLPREGSRK